MEPTLTDGQLRTLQALADGAWHAGSRTGTAATVIGIIGSALHRQGLVERKGSSRTAKPSNPGFSYRITERGRQVLVTAPGPTATAAMRELIERVMTQHWDLSACPCWFCTAGRAAGCRPRSDYLHDRRPTLAITH